MGQQTKKWWDMLRQSERNCMGAGGKNTYALLVSEGAKKIGEEGDG